jgi:nucleolar protein 56
MASGILNDTLRGFLEQNLDKAKPGKLTKFSLGVTDVKIGQAVQEDMFIKCVNDELVLELMRYTRALF